MFTEITEALFVVALVITFVVVGLWGLMATL